MDQAGPSRGRDRDVFIYDQEEYVPYDDDEDKGKSQVPMDDFEDDNLSSKNSNEEEGEVEDTVTEDEDNENTYSSQIVPLHKLQDSFKGMLKPLLSNVNSLNKKVERLSRRSESRSTRRSRSSSRVSSSHSYASRKRTRSPSSSPEKYTKSKRKEDLPEDEHSFENDLFEGDEAVGKNISSASKNILKTYFSKKLQRESLQTKLDRHPRPCNADFLKNPATNMPIWDKLKAPDRTLDIKIRKAQSNIIAGTVAAVRVLEKIDNEEQRRN